MYLLHLILKTLLKTFKKEEDIFQELDQVKKLLNFLIKH